MAVTVRSLDVVDRHHHTGNSWMDGDLTLWTAVASDRTAQVELFVVVPRGEAFIEKRIVRGRLENFESIHTLRAAARRDTRPGQRPQVHLNIEPGEA